MPEARRLRRAADRDRRRDATLLQTRWHVALVSSPSASAGAAHVQGEPERTCTRMGARATPASLWRELGIAVDLEDRRRSPEVVNTRSANNPVLTVEENVVIS